MIVDNILSHNEKFISSGEYEKYAVHKMPALRTAIVTCMDTRLLKLLPAALGIGGGDVKMIKNAGGMVTDPYGDTMRSLLVAVYELGVEHIIIIGHTGCGVEGMNGHHMAHLMRSRGVTDADFAAVRSAGIDLEAWMTGFTDVDEAVRRSVRLVAEHPLIPAGITVHGMVIDTVTGRLHRV